MRGGGELLGDGADGVAHLRRGGKGWGCGGGEACVAVGVGVDELAVLDDGDGGGGNAGLLEDLRGDAVDAGAEGWVDGADGLGGGGQGEREKRKDKDEGSLVHGISRAQVGRRPDTVKWYRIGVQRMVGMGVAVR